MQLNEEINLQKITKYAKLYKDHDFLHREVADRLIKNLECCKLRPERILDLGCKTGYLTNKLKLVYPDAEIYSLDSNQTILGYSSLVHDSLYSTICARADKLPFKDNTFDLIVSNMLIHWVNEHRKVFYECMRILEPEGLFLFSTLGQNSLYELKSAWETVDSNRHVHDFFDVTTLGNTMLAMKWCDPVIERQELIVNYSSMEKLMDDLKYSASTNVHVDRNKGLLTATKLAKMQQAYQEASNNEKISANFELIFGHALKGTLDTDEVENKEIKIPVHQIKINR